MLKDIYHGSDKIIREPIYEIGKAYNDYGCKGHVFSIS